MRSLADQIDHLAATASAISTVAAAAAALVPADSPFTRAVLDTALGDLIRDIDASELGLFTLVPPPDVQSDTATRRGEISRVAFPGATPLRRHPPRRDDILRPSEYDPEVYAHAALKYLDRYQSIRRMPRARSQLLALIDQLDGTRESIDRLNGSLQDLTNAGATPGSALPLTGVAEEERRITDLQNRLLELRNQKDAILRSTAPTPASKPNKAVEPTPPSPPEPVDREDAFWSTPAASARTLRFTDRLLEEEPDFAELSAMSFDSPGPAPPKSVFARLAAGNSPTNKGSRPSTDDDILGEPREDAREDLHDQSSLAEVEAGATESPDELDEEAEEPDENRTIILPKTPLSLQDNLLLSPLVDSQPQIIQPLHAAQSSPDSSATVPKVRITPELESIVARIWSAVGDILLPGKGGEKPPGAKETLTLVESLASRSPSPSSPTSSFSSVTSVTVGPTHHQVNTAQLLHALLTAPNHAMPLNQLKAAIGGTRALYACVAKKLVRIDRGGGEQIVLFSA